VVLYIEIFVFILFVGFTNPIILNIKMYDDD